MKKSLRVAAPASSSSLKPKKKIGTKAQFILKGDFNICMPWKGIERCTVSLAQSHAITLGKTD